MNRGVGMLGTLRIWLAILLLIAQTGFLGLIDLLAIPTVHAAMPATIGYQGRLKNSSGSVQTGAFNFIFRLYSVSSGGSPLYTEAQSGISVDQGFFVARIGSVTPFSPTFDFSQILYLSVEVNGDGEMLPRVPVNTVPYAFTSGGINPLASAPSFTTGGRTYYDTTTGLIHYYDATASVWRALSTSVATSSFSGLNWTSATGTSATTTNFFATNLTSGNASITGGAINGTTIGGTTPSTGVFTNVTSTNSTSTNLFVSGTVSTSQLFVNGGAVCLSNGTNCPAAAQSLAAVTALGATTTQTLQLFGGFIGASSTVTSTFTVLGQSSLQGLTFVNGTGTNLATTNLAVLGNVSTSLLPTLDASLALGSSALRWNAVFANTTSTNSTSTNFFSTNGSLTNLLATNATATNLSVSNFSFVNATSTGNWRVLGNVGIGPNPVVTQNNVLQINTSNSTVSNGPGSSAFEIDSNDGAKSDFFFRLSSSTAAGYPTVTLGRSDGTLATPSVVTNGMTIGGFTFNAFDGATWQYAAEIQSTIDGAPGVGDVPTKLSFFTTPDGSATEVERLTIKNNGFVGVNATNPAEFQLSVGGNVGATTNNTFDLGSATTSWRNLYTSGTIAFVNASGTNVTTTNLVLQNTISGAGLSADCSSVDSKLTWSATTKRFGCSEDLGGNVKSVTSVTAVNLTPAATQVPLSTITITPSSNTSDIWVTFSSAFNNSTAASRDITVQVWRGVASTCAGTQVGVNIITNLTAVATAKTVASGSFVDSPATTAATNYTLCAAASVVTPTAVGRSLTVSEVNLGADLAEIYYSQEGPLTPGTLVQLSPSLQGQVVRSESVYNSKVLGVVSTRPGLLIGQGGGSGSPVAVALSGRVPVRVSSANGSIQPGDYLTSSNTPGVAMKATKAGFVIGQALSTFTDEGEGTVMMFVKNGYYQGKLMAISTSTQSGVDILTQFINQPSVASSDNSLIVTDKLVAGLEVASSKITTQHLDVLNSFHAASATFDGLVYASSANIGLIINPQLDALTLGLSQASSSLQTVLSGLEFASSTLMTQDGRLTSLEALVSGLRDSLASVTSSLVAPTSSESGLSLADMHLDGGLEVDAQVLFHGGLKVDHIDSLNGLLTFASDTYFFGRPYVNADTAGFAIVKRGDRSVTVAFEREYLTQPVINATISFDDTEEATSTYDARVNSYFAENTAYVITRKSVHGFTILLDKPAADDITFNWIALAVKDARIILSSEGRPEIPLELSTPAASEPIPTASDSETASASTPPQDSTVLESDSTSSEVPPATEESAEPVVEAAPVVTESAPEETAPVSTETTAPASLEAVSQPTESAPAPEAPSAPPAESPAPTTE